MPKYQGSKWDLCVLGLGYVGLPTALLFAEKGLSVCAVDCNEDVLNALRSGKPLGAESGVSTLAMKMIRKRNLKITQKPEKSECYIIAVPTPVGKDNSPDVGMVNRALDDIAAHVDKGDMIVIESTCPIGTTRSLAERLQQKRNDLKIAKKHSEKSDVCFSYCPERVLPGNSLYEITHNSRTIGSWGAGSGDRAAGLYRQICEGRMTMTDAETAEMSKLVENAYRDVNIAFANEMSMLADKHSIDFNDLRNIVNQHPRVSMLQSGPGVGGHCIPVDPWFLIHDTPELTGLLQAARKSNIEKEAFIVQKIMDVVKKKKLNSLGFYGITYKADTSDIRESPSLRIIETIRKEHSFLEISVFDPYLCAEQIGKISLFQNEAVTVCKSIKCLEDKCDLVVLLTAHDQVKTSFRGNKKCPWVDYSGQDDRNMHFGKQLRAHKAS